MCLMICPHFQQWTVTMNQMCHTDELHLSHTFAPLRYLICWRKTGDHVDSAIKAFITLWCERIPWIPYLNSMNLGNSLSKRDAKVYSLGRQCWQCSVRKTLRFYKFINFNKLKHKWVGLHALTKYKFLKVEICLVQNCPCFPLLLIFADTHTEHIFEITQRLYRPNSIKSYHKRLRKSRAIVFCNCVSHEVYQNIVWCI